MKFWWFVSAGTIKGEEKNETIGNTSTSLDFAERWVKDAWGKKSFASCSWFESSSAHSAFSKKELQQLEPQSSWKPVYLRVVKNQSQWKRNRDK